MRTVLLLSASSALALSAAFSIASGAVAPLWLLLPGLAFALFVGLATVTQQWMRLLVLASARLVVIVLALAVLAVATFAVATTPWSWPSLEWSAFICAILVLTIALTPPSTRRSRHV